MMPAVSLRFGDASHTRFVKAMEAASGGRAQLEKELSLTPGTSDEAIFDIVRDEVFQELTSQGVPHPNTTQVFKDPDSATKVFTFIQNITMFIANALMDAFGMGSGANDKQLAQDLLDDFSQNMTSTEQLSACEMMNGNVSGASTPAEIKKGLQDIVDGKA